MRNIFCAGMRAHWGSLHDRLHDVLRTMRKKIKLLDLSEVRWPGHGVSQLDGTVIIHSGMTESYPQN